MSMYVKKQYNGFMATVTVESDEINEIDLKSKEFRIDFIDVVEQSAKAEDYAIALEEIKNDGHIVDENLKVASYALRQALYAAKDKDNESQITDGEFVNKLNSVYESVASYTDGIPSAKQLSRNIPAWCKYLKSLKNGSLVSNASVKAASDKITIASGGESEIKLTSIFNSSTETADGATIDANGITNLNPARSYTLSFTIETNAKTSNDFLANAAFNNDLAIKRFTNKTADGNLAYNFSIMIGDENFPKGIVVSNTANHIDVSMILQNPSASAVEYKLTEFSLEKAGSIGNEFAPPNPYITTFIDDAIAKIQECQYIADKMSNLSYDNIPMLSIKYINDDIRLNATEMEKLELLNVEGSDVFCNADYESLLRNGMQYWISENKKMLTFRFIPQMRAKYHFQAVHCVISFDHNNVTQFDVSLLPRLISGDIEKNDDTDADVQIDLTKDGYTIEETECSRCDGTGEIQKWDPVEGKYVKIPCPDCSNGKVPCSASRVDYIYNTYEQDHDHLYVNNGTNVPGQKETPLYKISSSAYISEPMYVSGGYNFNMKKNRSYLYDTYAASALNLPYKIRPFNGEWTDDKETIVSKDFLPAETVIKLIPDYWDGEKMVSYHNDEICEETVTRDPETGLVHSETYTELNMLTAYGYEIVQTISASGDLSEENRIFAKNQVYLSMEV